MCGFQLNDMNIGYNSSILLGGTILSLEKMQHIFNLKILYNIEKMKLKIFSTFETQIPYIFNNEILSEKITYTPKQFCGYLDSTFFTAFSIIDQFSGLF